MLAGDAGDPAVLHPRHASTAACSRPTSTAATPPPAGAPNYMLGLATRQRSTLWRFHVDWATPTNSTLTGPTTHPVAVSPFTPACSGTGGTCIPQTERRQKLDSLGDRLMYRLAYRNFGDHESLVVNHSVTAGSVTGIRWYELPRHRTRTGPRPSTSRARTRPTAHVPLDGKRGDGRRPATSRSATASRARTTFPGIAYTGQPGRRSRSATMTQGETVLQDGGRLADGRTSRWGDYSSMSIDPSRRLHVLVHERVPARAPAASTGGRGSAPSSCPAAQRRPPTRSRWRLSRPA